MRWTYNTGIFLYALAAKCFGLFNAKAKQFSNGRIRVFDEIITRVDRSKKHIWFHFASLGEFEQGRPVMEQLKAENPDKELIVTFFSPSGYEIRKHYQQAAGVFYLPMDTAANAKRFIELINPEFAVFTKYEFWYHYFKELKKKDIPLYLISGIFRKDQVFFKWYGNFYREILHFVTYFFVQNEESAKLLATIGLHNVDVSGDTRFDRVAENAKNPRSLALIAEFCGESPVLICGSTWPDDEKLLSVLPDKYPDWKFIIAPHEVDAEHVNKVLQQFPGSILYSGWELGVQSPELGVGSPESKVQSPKSEVLSPGTNRNTQYATRNTLIIDNIGMLSSLYQYGRVAYIGGGFGAGIHNTLEAAAFGLPVIFGPKYDKFQEAKDLVIIGAAKSITSADDLLTSFAQFIDDKNASAIAKKYVNDKKGATSKVLKLILGS